MNKFAYGLPKEIMQKRNQRIKDADSYKGMRVRPTMDMIANSIEHVVSLR